MNQFYTLFSMQLHGIRSFPKNTRDSHETYSGKEYPSKPLR